MRGNFFNNVTKSSLDVATIDWIKRVRRNGGGTPSTKTIVASDYLIKDLKKYNLFNMMYSLVTLSPDNIITATTPLVKTTGNDPWTNNLFVADDLTIKGLKGNASTKYLDTGINSSLLPTSYNGFSVIESEGAFGAKYAPIGAFVAGGDSSHVLIDNAVDLYYDSYNTSTSGGRLASTTADPLPRFFGASRTSIESAIFIGKSELTKVGYLTTTGGTRPNLPIYAFCFCNNTVGSIGQSSSIRYSCMAVHAGLTQQQTTLFYAATNTFRQRLGGGSV